jgi:hypothetical protein
MFYALATNEEFLANKVNLFVALAPVIRLTNSHDGFLGDISKHEGLLY